MPRSSLTHDRDYRPDWIGFWGKVSPVLGGPLPVVSGPGRPVPRAAKSAHGCPTRCGPETRVASVECPLRSRCSDSVAWSICPSRPRADAWPGDVTAHRRYDARCLRTLTAFFSTTAQRRLSLTGSVERVLQDLAVKVQVGDEPSELPILFLNRFEPVKIGDAYPCVRLLSPIELFLAYFRP